MAITSHILDRVVKSCPAESGAGETNPKHFIKQQVILFENYFNSVTIANYSTAVVALFVQGLLCSSTSAGRPF